MTHCNLENFDESTSAKKWRFLKKWNKIEFFGENNQVYCGCDLQIFSLFSKVLFSEMLRGQLISEYMFVEWFSVS